MNTLSYRRRRAEIEHYFDRTAAEAWSRLTSTAPVGRIRQSVRAGRDEMRDTLLGWLPSDLSGRRILDAGCGTGAFAIEAARRGAEVVAIDLSPSLVRLARERTPDDIEKGRVDFRVGDMCDIPGGGFDHVVAMDSLIHYSVDDALAAISRLSSGCRQSILFTFAPRTPLLAVMHAVGRRFPRSDRAPSIVPIRASVLDARIGSCNQLVDWRRERTRCIRSGFYTSQAMELVRP